MECSLLSNCLPKINQIWTHLSWAHQHQCHPLLNWKLGADTSWSVQKKCGTCVLCHIVCLLPFLPSPSILEAKMEDRIYNVVAFCAGTQLDWGAEEHTYGMLGRGVCNTGKKDTVE